MLLVLSWAVAGTGVGVGYPVLYVAATEADTVPGTAALTLATAVVSAETVGELAGGAVGSSAVPLQDAAGLPGLALSTALATACLLVAAWWAARTTAPADRPAEARYRKLHPGRRGYEAG